MTDIDHDEISDQKSVSDESENEPEQKPLDPELLVKHPLQNRWSLWYFKNDKNRDWKDNLKIVSTFGFVEDFWALYNHIQPASKIGSGCDYSVFKEGIQPAWEDERNKNGGRWVINANKNQRAEELDRFWLDILLCLIGEAFGEASDEVCGAVVNIRSKGDKVGVWTANAVNKDATMHIGRTLKERLGIPPKVILGYEKHDDSISKKGSTTRTQYQV